MFFCLSGGAGEITQNSVQLIYVNKKLKEGTMLGQQLQQQH